MCKYGPFVRVQRDARFLVAILWRLVAMDTSIERQAAVGNLLSDVTQEMAEPKTEIKPGKY